MVKLKQRSPGLLLALPVISVFSLTGCPWGGVRYYPAETSSVWMKDNAVCFSVPDSKDYRPVFISINLRSTPSKERKFTSQPKLHITDGQLCIAPSFYHFSDTLKDPFIVETVLQSSNKKNHPRSFVVGFEITKGKAQDVPLTTREYDVPEN